MKLKSLVDLVCAELQRDDCSCFVKPDFSLFIEELNDDNDGGKMLRTRIGWKIHFWLINAGMWVRSEKGRKRGKEPGRAERIHA